MHNAPWFTRGSKMRTIEITREVATKVLQVVDVGLVKGVGKPKPGEMCVEAAVCFAMGLPHGDEPACVAPALRALKISLNDRAWSSNAARASGLRRLALAQLGSAGALDEREFRRRVVDLALGSCVPNALRAAASVQKDEKHKYLLLQAANRCERERSREAASDARATARAAAADAYADADADAAAAADADAAADAAAGKAARDKLLATFAEQVVQILIDMKAPGCQWLDLAPLQGAA